MHQLSSDTVRLLSSAQVITSVLSVVKELVENSVDAKADNIEVKLENFGLDRVEVRDNGDGISPEDTQFMGQQHYTSKLKEFNDLLCVTSYGFRGEALGSLCSLSDVTVTTKRECDPVSKVYTLNHHGTIVATKPSHLGKGTTICATQLFKNIPVRKQYYSNSKRKKEELKKVEDLLMCYGVVHPGIRLSLSHNKSNVWQKNKASNTKTALLNTFGSSTMSHLQVVESCDSDTKIKLQGYVPKPNSDLQLVGRSHNDRSWFIINSRPVHFKEAEKLLKQYFSRCRDDVKTLRHLVGYLHFTIPTEYVDVNLEPNKTKVVLQNNDAVLSLLIKALEEVYPNKAPDAPKSSLPPLPELEMPKNRDEPSLQQSHHRSERPRLREIDSNHLNSNNEVKTHEETEVMHRKMNTAHDNEALCGSDLIGARNVRLSPHHVQSCNAVSEDHATQEPNFSLFNEDILLNSQLSDSNLKVGSATNSEALTNERYLNVDNEKESEHAKNDLGESVENDERLFGDVTERIEQSVSKSEWSKGVGVLTGEIEPVKVFMPGVTIATAESPDIHIDRQLVGKSKHDVSVEPSVKSLNSNYSIRTALDFDTAESENVADIGKNTNPENLQSESASSVQLQNDDSTTRSSLSITPRRSPIRKPQNASEKGGMESPSRNKKLFEEKTGNLYDLLSQTPVRRPQDSFAHFVKTVQPQVARDNPSADNNTIQLLLEEGWEQLTSDERKKYECIATKDKKRYESQLSAAQNSAVLKRRGSEELPPQKKKKVVPPPNHGRIDQMLASQERRHHTANPKGAEVVPSVTKDIPFSIDVLNNFSFPKRRNPEDAIELVGPLPSFHVWLAVEDKHLVAFNVYRAEEALLYRKLMASHVLSTRVVDPAIVLDASMVGGGDNWLTLLSMESEMQSPQNTRHFNDKRLASNGFVVRQLMDEASKDVRIEVISMATSIPCFGISDLIEILDIITDRRNVHLSNCRPLKVKNYLKSEAVRIARSRPKDVQAEDLLEIMASVHSTFQEEERVCVHDKPITHRLCKLPRN